MNTLNAESKIYFIKKDLFLKQIIFISSVLDIFIFSIIIILSTFFIFYFILFYLSKLGVR